MSRRYWERNKNEDGTKVWEFKLNDNNTYSIRFDKEGDTDSDENQEEYYESYEEDGTWKQNANDSNEVELSPTSWNYTSGTGENTTTCTKRKAKTTEKSITFTWECPMGEIEDQTVTLPLKPLKLRE
jgi:hypothetical protein